LVSEKTTLLGSSVNRVNCCNPLALNVNFWPVSRRYNFSIRNKQRREREHVGRKSSSQDKGEGASDNAKRKAKEAIGAVTGDKEKKAEGALDKAKGKAKEATGALSGDKEKKAEGRSEQTKGTAKDKLGKAKDLLK
jgi:uncharacterized protein YjbJ (UPF0337 family)